MSEGDSPRMRASDDDRNRVAAALSEAFSRGQLDYEEFDDRTKQVWEARHHDELLATLSDLMPHPARVLDGQLPALRPDPSPDPVRPSPDRVPGHDLARRQVTGEPGGQSFTFALMGASEKRGDWLVAPEHVTAAVMAGTEVDLRRARFQGPETVITAIALMGGVDVVVPEDVRVVNDGIGVMGAFEIEEDDDVTIEMRDLPADAPVVKVRGLAIMGGVSVRRARRDSTD